MSVTIKWIFEKEQTYHILFWVGWIFLTIEGDSKGLGFYHQRNHELTVPIILSLMLNVMIFYGHAFWIIPKFLTGKKIGRYVLVLLLFFLISLLIKTSVEMAFVAHYSTARLPIKWIDLMRENLFTLTLFLFLSFAFWAYQKQKREKEWIVREKISNELALLKAQISPHFLFNTLNNLYSLGLQNKTEEVTHGILKLSNILRYVLYENKVKKISLRKEMEYIQDYVEINKMMIDRNQWENIVVKMKGNPDALSLPPLLLLTFVENAFKFGLTNRGEVSIFISAHIENSNLIFKVENRINEVQNKDSRGDHYSGIGLGNVKQQLELLYPNAYSLSAMQEEDIFKVNLKIKLSS